MYKLLKLYMYIASYLVSLLKRHAAMYSYMQLCKYKNYKITIATYVYYLQICFLFCQLLAPPCNKHKASNSSNNVFLGNLE